MPKYSATSPLNYSTLEGFRNFITDIDTGILAAGCSKTEDTGQLENVTDVTVFPTAAAYTYYKLYRFGDSLQSVQPIVFKIVFSRTTSSTSNNAFIIYVEVGTGSDGAGAITGKMHSMQVSNAAFTTHANSAMVGAASTTKQMPSYFCHTEGFFGMVLWVGAAEAYQGRVPGCFFWFTITRSVDDTGAFTSEGFHVVSRGQMHMHNNVFSAGAIAYCSIIDGVQSAHQGSGAVVVGGTDGGLMGGAVQVYKHFAVAAGGVRQIPTIGAVSRIYATVDQFQFALIGTTKKNFICMGPEVNPADVMTPVNAAPAASLVMLWED